MNVINTFMTMNREASTDLYEVQMARADLQLIFSLKFSLEGGVSGYSGASVYSGVSARIAQSTVQTGMNAGASTLLRTGQGRLYVEGAQAIATNSEVAMAAARSFANSELTLHAAGEGAAFVGFALAKTSMSSFQGDQMGSQFMQDYAESLNHGKGLMQTYDELGSSIDAGISNRNITLSKLMNQYSENCGSN